MNRWFKLCLILPLIIIGCKNKEIDEKYLSQSFNTMNMNIFSRKGEKLITIKSPYSNYDRERNTFNLKDTIGGARTFSGNITVTGNLTVNGTTTTVNSNTVSVGDNIIVLNSDETGTPSQNAGIEVERGTSTNRSLRWNETTDKWQVQTGDSTYGDIATGGGSVCSVGRPCSGLLSDAALMPDASM